MLCAIAIDSEHAYDTESKGAERMKTKMLKKARTLWNTGDRRLDRYNQRAWVQAIRRLGDKWLLATHVQRKEAA